MLEVDGEWNETVFGNMFGHRQPAGHIAAVMETDLNFPRLA